MMSSTSIVVARVVAALCGSAAFPGSLQSQAVSKPTTYAIEQPPNGYLTEQNIKNAKPIEPPRTTEKELKALRGQGRNLPDLPKADLKTYGVPTDANVATFPYNSAGKLLIWFPETPQNDPESCTAQFVGNETVLLTAAHCLQHETGVWARYYAFFQGYNQGAMIQRVELTCPAVMTGWATTSGSRWRWDYAFLKTRMPSTTGYFGLDARIPDPSLEAIGYPTNFGAREKMQIVTGSRGTVIENFVRMDGNPYGKGASGGAWHVNGTVMGNNSRNVEGMWSPLYDANTVVLWRYANNNCH